VMQTTNRNSDLLKQLPKGGPYIVPPFSSPMANLLARDAVSDTQVFELQEWPADMAEAGPQTKVLSAVLFTGDNRIIALTGKSTYKPGAGPIEISGQATTLGTPPIYTPAAVNTKVEQVLLRDSLYSVAKNRASRVGSIALDWESIDQVRIADDGSILAFSRNGNISQWIASESNPRHTLLGINRAVDRSISADAQRVYLLRLDGSVEEWRMDAFDATGWAPHLQ